MNENKKNKRKRKRNKLGLVLLFAHLIVFFTTRKKQHKQRHQRTPMKANKEIKNITGRKKNRFVLVLLVAQLIVFFSIGMSMAWLMREVNLSNRLFSHTTSVVIEEVYTQNTPAVGNVFKEVKFTNQGRSSVFLRVTFVETWVYFDIEENVYRYLPNVISENYVALKNFHLDEWYIGDDGWYYYKKILSSGESTPVLLQSINFAEYVDEFEIYQYADYQLYFKVESIQASDGSGTLNSDTVNLDATTTLFLKHVVVDQFGNVTWSEVED